MFPYVSGAAVTPTSQVRRALSEMREATPPDWGSVQGGHPAVVAGMGGDSTQMLVLPLHSCDLRKAPQVLVTPAVQWGWFSSQGF